VSYGLRMQSPSQSASVHVEGFEIRLSPVGWGTVRASSGRGQLGLSEVPPPERCPQLNLRTTRSAWGTHCRFSLRMFGRFSIRHPVGRPPTHRLLPHPTYEAGRCPARSPRVSPFVSILKRILECSPDASPASHPGTMKKAPRVEGPVS
jgi:hypothetical protein